MLKNILICLIIGYLSLSCAQAPDAASTKRAALKNEQAMKKLVDKTMIKNPLEKAILEHDSKAVSHLLHSYPQLLHEPILGLSPLIFAITKMEPDIVNVLLDNNAPFIDQKNGLSEIKVLLLKGIEPHGETILHAIVDAIHKRNITAQPILDASLYLAVGLYPPLGINNPPVKNYYQKIINFLVNQGASSNYKTVGETTLEMAIAKHISLKGSQVSSENYLEEILKLIHQQENIADIKNYFAIHESALKDHAYDILVALAHYAHNKNIDPRDYETPVNEFISEIVHTENAKPWIRPSDKELPFEIYPYIDFDGGIDLHRIVSYHGGSFSLIKTKYPQYDHALILTRPQDLEEYKKRINNPQEALNIRTKISQQTPLMLALHYNDNDMARLLVQLGSNLNLKDKNGDTIFYYMMKYNKQEFFKELFDDLLPYTSLALKVDEGQTFKGLLQYARDHNLNPFADIMIHSHLGQEFSDVYINDVLVNFAHDLLMLSIPH